MISYNDIVLLQYDSTFAEWVRGNFPLGEISFWAKPITDTGSMSGNAENSHYFMPLGDINYTQWCKPAEVNTLYWPSGAQRWGSFIGVADSTIKDQLLEAAVDGPHTLRISNTADDYIEVPMYMLEPKRVTCTGEGDSDPQDGWLIPFVDGRYFWQFCHTGELSVPASWSSLFSTLTGQLPDDVTVASVSANYLVPCTVELGREDFNVPAMLDACLYSVGQRLVGDLSNGGAYKTINIDGVMPEVDSAWTRPSGGAAGSSEDLSYPSVWGVPEQVNVSFRKQTAAGSSAEHYSYSQSTGVTNKGHTAASSLAKRIHSAAWANCSAGSTPSNNSDLSTLATQLALDFGHQCQCQYHYVFNGVIAWPPHFNEDIVLVSERATRVRSQPPNVGPERMFHGSDQPDEPAKTWQCYLDTSPTNRQTVTTESTLELGTVQHANSAFSISSNEISCSRTGKYIVGLKLNSTDDGYAAEDVASGWLEKYDDSSSSWVEVSGTKINLAAGFSHNTGAEEAEDINHEGFVAMVVDHDDADDKYRVRVTPYKDWAGNPASADTTAYYISGGTTDKEGCYLWFQWVETT